MFAFLVGADDRRSGDASVHTDQLLQYVLVRAPAGVAHPARDRVITTTVDAAGYDAETKMVTAPGNPQTGPFYIEGAEPGDTLVVTIERIEPNRKFAFSLDVLAPYTVDPGFLRSASAEQGTNVVLWEIDKVAGVARLSSDAEAVRRFEREGSRTGFMRRFGYRVASESLEVPLAPMLGCLGTAPAGKEAIRSGVPARHGGNMDYAGTVEGVKVMLPVSEPGALFFLGDGHAKQGHGELVGTGVEVSMDVEFTVDLIKGSAIGWPRMENDDFIMVLGSARPSSPSATTRHDRASRLVDVGLRL